MFRKTLECFPTEVHEYFQSLGLDIWDAWTFFRLLDADGGGEAGHEKDKNLPKLQAEAQNGEILPVLATVLDPLFIIFQACILELQ